MQDEPALLRVQADPRIVIDPSEVGRVVEEIFPEALGVWIYGSFAHGRARRDSDLDIAILPAAPLDSWERLERAQGVASASIGRWTSLICRRYRTSSATR